VALLLVERGQHDDRFHVLQHSSLVLFSGACVGLVKSIKDSLAHSRLFGIAGHRL
jgi:hypothetical protein